MDGVGEKKRECRCDYHLTKELCHGINPREKVTSYGVERFDRKRSRHIFLRSWMASLWNRQQYAKGLFRPAGRYRLEQGKAG
jgi:hypothetical protein